MMTHQLGRILLSTATGSEDEMSARPGIDASYGPLDALLADVASMVRRERDAGSDRRPENVSSTG